MPIPRLLPRLASSSPRVCCSCSTGSFRPFSITSLPRSNDTAIPFKLLAEPSWSVQALLPSKRQIQESSEVTPAALRHLLKLCALPPPASEIEELKMLDDLKAQLHFVKQVQKVQTENIKPQRSVRDESITAKQETEVSLASLKDALAQEVIVGRHHRRIRRMSDATASPNDHVEDWDVLGQAPKKIGKFFVVEGKET